MKFTLSWLEDYLEFDADLTQISETLTAIGLEVEAIENKAEQLAGFTVAKILEAAPHPDADKLQVCRVQTGEGELQIVCGAPNARAGIYVVLAPVGVLIPTNGMKIKQSKIRGVESCGMLCSSAELGLGDDAAGILELAVSDDTIGQDFATVAGYNDPVIEIAITPNRGDCLGVYGIARDLAAAGLGTLKPLAVESAKTYGPSPITVRTDAKHCPLFVGRYFKNVTNGPSPLWLQQRLEAIGLRPISALVDITNYIAFSYGRPLHVYDADRLEGGLEVRAANDGETLVALDEAEYTLDSSMAVVADSARAQAVAGIIGGLESGCAIETQNVFLEVALFDAVAVSMTGRKLDIITDSRYRFERNVDPEFVMDAAEIATQMIVSLCGGQASELVVAGTAPQTQRVIAFDFCAVKKRSGVAISDDEIKAILERLGFVVNGNDVIVPSWRSDVEASEDLVEEVVRIYGFEHIPSTPLPINDDSVEAVLDIHARRRKKIQTALAARGMMEAITWSFMDSKTAGFFADGGELVRLQNPISSELSVMRPSLLPNLIAAVRSNAERGYPNRAFFEYGRLYHGVTANAQHPVIALLRSGQWSEKTVHDAARTVDVYDIKADVIAALEVVGFPVNNLRIQTPGPSWYHPGRSGVMMLGKQVIAQFGQLHPSVTQALDCDLPLVGAELFLHHLPPSKKRKSTARAQLEISEYQASRRDFAVVVDSDAEAGVLMRSVASSHKLITEASLFDVYAGKGVEEGKKSLAFSVRIQAQDHTLTEDELNDVSRAVIAVVEKCGGALRG